MVHVITQSCCSDAGCVSVCPVNCIHPTPEERGFGTSDILHIDPVACIDCGACADACPVDAIYPADRLGDRDRVFIEVNAAYYRDNPDITSGWTDIVYPDIPRLPDGLRVAVVGTGPAGGYVLRTLLGRTDARVTVIDRLPTPGGLVRAGVAPDHPGTKGVLRSFDLLHRDPRVTLVTNVEIGPGPGQIAPAELDAHFDAVFYAVGATDSRNLGIPGEDLAGSTSATELVAWYNGVPATSGGVIAQGPPIPEDGTGRAVVVGTGNVALDVARILVSSPEALARTDIADRALELLGRQGVREVVLLGRRGADSAAYTPAEFRALEALPDVTVAVCDGDDPAELAELGLDRPPRPDARRIVFVFHSRPTAIDDDGRGRAAAVRVRTGPVAETSADLVVPADLVVRSIGYRGTPIEGLPFDEDRAVLPSEDGRVLDADGRPTPGVYAAGWATRGADGGIGANKAHAVATVESFVEDAAHDRLPRATRTAEEFQTLIRVRCRDAVDYAGVAAIDRAERDRGRLVGRPRVKFVQVADMLAAVGRRR